MPRKGHFFMDKKKSKLLLHICCGVCGAWLPEMLSTDYDVAFYFFNPNIYPQEEYGLRRDAARGVAQTLGMRFIEGAYEPQAWHAAVKGLENELEGGRRCEVCFDFRLQITARYAKENGFDIFASTLTIGRNKRGEVINPIGEKWGKHFGIKFLAGDWKKQGGQQETDKKSKEMGVYRQNYCGCVYSMRG